MKKIKYKKFIIYILSIIILLLLLFYFINDKNNENNISTKLKDFTSTISKIIYYPFYYNKKDNIKIVLNKQLKNENNELKKELNLNKTMSDYKFINSNIIKRSSSYWYNIITIDKGKKSNIKKGNIVINYNGVVGIVYRVYTNSSDVKLLTSKNKNNYISVMFSYNNNNYYGLIDNYNIVKNELHLKNVVGDFDNLNNIDVTTSGLNDENSKGLLIGKIKRFKKTNYGISNDIYITPSVNFNNINVVSVVIK